VSEGSLREWHDPTPISTDPAWDRATWLEQLRDVPDDATWPRYMSAPHPCATGSYGAEYAEWVAERLGDELLWWQALVAARVLEHDRAGDLVWRTWLVSTARQVGKSWQLRGLAVWRIEQAARFGELQVVLHTGKDLPVCRYVQRPARSWARRHKHEGYDAREGNGREAVTTPDGSEWLVRGRDSVYGYSVSMGLVDEAWDVAPEIVDDGLEPTMVSRVNPQLGLLSTAHRAATSLFPKRREQAIREAGAPDDTLILEWSAHPAADLDDRSEWRAASPRWNARREKAVSAALDRARQSPDRDPLEADPLESFRAQWLNIWPTVSTRVTLRDSPLVEQVVWAELTDLTVRRPARLVVAVDDRAGRGGATSAAGLTVDGRILVWGMLHPSRRAALTWADMLDPVMLLIGPGLKADAPRGRVVNAAEGAAALAKLRDLIGDRQLVHDGGTELAGQVCGLRVREAAGGLVPTTPGASDLVRCAAWACWQVAAVPAPRAGWAVL
jgi:hypothetical protein